MNDAVRRWLAISVLVTMLVVGTFAIVANNEVQAVPVPSSAQTAPYFNVTDVEVGIYVNGLSNFDFGKGAYSLDFYLWFRWSDPNISSMNFEIMNGHPAYSNAFQKIVDNTSGELKEQWFRLRADLFIPPDLTSYPFESGGLKVELEDAVLNNTLLRYHWASEGSGYDATSLVMPGWKIAYLNYTVGEHEYTFGETYSKATFTIQVERNSLPAAIQIIMPPIIFCLVSSLSFFFRETKEQNIGIRLGLNSSMIISAVLFYYGQQSSLPPMSSFSIFDEMMISVYVFGGGGDGLLSPSQKDQLHQSVRSDDGPGRRGDGVRSVGSVQRVNIRSPWPLPAPPR
jgi:hypothetical protein